MKENNYGYRVSSHKPVNLNGARRLGWFFDFLRMHQISLEEAASYLSYTRPSLQHWKLVDDANLSYVERIVEETGYHIEIKIWKGNNYDEVETVTRREMSYLLPYKRNPGRLKPLVAAMVVNNYTIQRIARELQINKNAVRYWFNMDDILLSRLFEVVAAMGCNLFIHVLKNSNICSSAIDAREPLFFATVDGLTYQTSFKEFAL